jgi:hypothetical protein
MRRSFLTLAAVAMGLLMTTGEASACHKKKCACPTPVVCVPPPVVVCAPKPVCAPKVKHGHKLFAHKPKATCAAPVAYTYYAPTVTPSGQVPSGQMIH